jgi:hypothetical protein
MELARSKDPESYAGGSVTLGRASHTGQVKGDDPDEMEYPGPTSWGLDVRLTPSPRKIVDVEKNSEMPRRGLINRRRSGYKGKDDFWYMGHPHTVQNLSTNTLALTAKKYRLDIAVLQETRWQ